MREGINDKILKKQMELQNRAIIKVNQILKGEKPFAMEKIDDGVKLNLVNSLTGEEILSLVEEFGEQKVNQLIFEAKMYEKRMMAKGGI